VPLEEGKTKKSYLESSVARAGERSSSPLLPSQDGAVASVKKTTPKRDEGDVDVDGTVYFAGDAPGDGEACGHIPKGDRQLRWCKEPADRGRCGEAGVAVRGCRGLQSCRGTASMYQAFAVFWCVEWPPCRVASVQPDAPETEKLRGETKKNRRKHSLAEPAITLQRSKPRQPTVGGSSNVVRLERSPH